MCERDRDSPQPACMSLTECRALSLGHAGRRSCPPRAPLCADLLDQRNAMCSTSQNPPCTHKRHRGSEGARTLRECVRQASRVYSCAVTNGNKYIYISKRKQFWTCQTPEHNKCHKSSVMQLSPLHVSCCLARCRWLVLHPGPPCLFWRGLKMTAALCGDDCRLHLTLRAASTSRCNNCLSKTMNIRLVCYCGCQDISTRNFPLCELIHFWFKTL